MTHNVQYRAPKWQAQAIEKTVKARDIRISDLGRFAINYLFVHYKGPMNHDIFDTMEFEARQKMAKAHSL